MNTYDFYLYDNGTRITIRKECKRPQSTKIWKVLNKAMDFIPESTLIGYRLVRLTHKD